MLTSTSQVRRWASIGQDDDLGNYGYAGLTQVRPVVSGPSHGPAILSTGVASQISAVKAAAAEVIVSFSIPAATALDNGLITDSFGSASGETPNPWVPLAISIHSAYDANEPIGTSACPASRPPC